MDNRIILNPGNHLRFPGMDCEIEEIVGRGSNALVYLGRYEDALNRGLFHHVIIKELFPYHPENLIHRNSEGIIEINESAKEYFELQKKSFEAGNEIHLRMLEKHPDKIGANINTFPLNGTLYSVLGFDGGKSLDKKYDPDRTELSQVILLIRDIIDAVEIFHKAGYLHLDISPDNILLIGDGEKTRKSLIDYNSIHPIDELESGQALYCSAKEGYTAPEVLSGEVTAFCEGSDIYSITAVFYWLLMGKRLTLYQRLSKNPPDVRSSPLLKNAPDTVCSRISLILRRGLSVLPSKRYRDCESMRKDINELLERAQGIGITHAALWESGKRIIERKIKSNPALHYLKNEQELFPLRVTTSSGESCPVSAAIENLLTEGSALLCAPAGMGKTTALLHTVITRSKRYLPLQPVVIYVSLFDYNNSGENFIKNRILEDLKFNAEIGGMEDARNRLVKEFNEKIRTRDGEKTKYLLLVDGLNEADGDTLPLLNEINALSQMKGVRLLVSSRSENAALPFPALRLTELNEEDIKAALSKKHLIYPESEEMKELLKTPLLLSLFCKAAVNNEKQLSCSNAYELMNEYLKGITEKELRLLPEESPKKWLIDASVGFVLPFVCAEIAKNNKEVTDKELLRTLTKCFRILSDGRLYRLFPQYIGHSKDIKSGAKNAEQWYGDVIIKLLWRRMGLLVKEPDRGYKLMHQLLAEHLLLSYEEMNRKLKKQSLIRCSSSFLVSVLVIILLASIIRPDPFDRELSKSYLDSIVISQVHSGGEILTLSKLLEVPDGDEEGFEATAYSLKSKLETHKELLAKEAVGSLEMTEKIADELKETGKVMPWSKEKLNESDVEALLDLNKEIAENYGLYADILHYLRSNEDLDNRYGQKFRECLVEKIKADAALSDALFYSSCLIHLEPMKKSDSTAYEYYWLTLGENADLSDSEPMKPDTASIERLKKVREEKSFELDSLEIFTIYRRITQ